MKSTLSKGSIPFTQVSNKLLNDANISLKAKGLFAYMFSKPEGWNFTLISIASQLKEGKDSIHSAMKELRDNGYVSWRKNSDGTSEYLLKVVPSLEGDLEPNPQNPNKPNTDNPKVGKPRSGFSRRISNKDISNKDLKSNKEREERAHDFFKNNFQWDYEKFLMDYQSKIKNFQKFTDTFNDVFDKENLPFELRVIRGRINQFARNWVERQDRNFYQSTASENSPKPNYTKNAI